MKRTWTEATAKAYIDTAREKGLTYWSAYDYLTKMKSNDKKNCEKKEAKKHE